MKIIPTQIKIDIKASGFLGPERPVIGIKTSPITLKKYDDHNNPKSCPNTKMYNHERTIN